jgi:hypothetical protein
LAKLDDLCELAKPLGDGSAARSPPDLLHAHDSTPAHVEKTAHAFVRKVEAVTYGTGIDDGC